MNDKETTPVTRNTPTHAPPHILLRDQIDSDISAWVQSRIGASVQSSKKITNNTRLAIYGADYHDALQRDLPQIMETGAKVALCLDEWCADSYLDLLHMNVRHIIYPQSPFANEALHLAEKSTTAGYRAIWTSGDEPRFEPADDVLKSSQYELSTSNDCTEIPDAAEDFFLNQHLSTETTGNVCLALKEAVTNSLFHGFRTSGTDARKYEPENFSALEQDDKILVTLAAAKNWCALRVTDNSGSLGPLRVANSLDRHRGERGLLDSRGRGFHLMRHLAHRIVIYIKRGAQTSVELYFLRDNPGNISRHFELVEI